MLDDCKSKWPREMAIRIGCSALIWCGFGIVVGICISPEPTVIGMIAGSIAGMIVLTPLGAILGMMGGRPFEVLSVGGVGLTVGSALGMVQGGDWRQWSAMGLIMGGLVGATFVPFFWRLPRLLSRFARDLYAKHQAKQPVFVTADIADRRRSTATLKTSR